MNVMVARKLSCLGRLAERIYGGRDERHHGHRFVDDQLGHHAAREARHQNERRAQNQRGIQNYVQAVDVVERKTAENVVGGVELRRIRPQQLVHVGDQIVVREHHSFGQAGGTAGVGKRRESLFGRLIRLGIDRCDRAEQVGEWLGARGDMLARRVDAA